MANSIREALTVDQQPLFLFMGGMSKVGFGVTGTWVGTVSFFWSADGVNFFPLTVQPFPPTAPFLTTGVQSATANGNWEALVQNGVAIKVVFSRISGTAVVTLAASLDSSYQSAFLVPSSIYVSQEVSAGAQNQIVQAAQPNRAWRLRTLSIGMSLPPANAVKVQVLDGGSTVLWEEFVGGITATGGLGGTTRVNLPLDANTPGLASGGVVGTPGNSMTVTLSAPGGSVVSSVNAEFIPA